MKNKVLKVMFFLITFINLKNLSGQINLLNSELFSETEIQPISKPEVKMLKIREIPELQPLSPIEKVFNSQEKIEEFERKIKEFYRSRKKGKVDFEIIQDIKKVDFEIIQDIKKLGIIRQFGYSFFSIAPTTFAPVTEVPVGPDYILGPGDEIVINVWGMIEGSYVVQIDREGGIFIPKIGRIYLWGKKFEEAKKEIEEAFRRQYKNFEISISMGKLRTIKVHIAGEVKYPGTYEISSLSTLFNALYVCGGPTKNGSLRKINLLRNNKIVGSFDLYKFLLYGDKSNDFRLQSGDVIFVEPIGNVVAIYGNCIKRPGIYEIKEEKNLKDLINMAGGIFSFGIEPKIKVGIPEEGKMKYLSLKEKNYFLKGGEAIEISTNILTRKREKVVELRGEIKNPGSYIIEEGERLSSVLERAGGYTKNAFLKGAVFTRESVKKLQQQRINQFIKKQQEILLGKIPGLFEGKTTERLELLRQQKELINIIASQMPLGRISIHLKEIEELKGCPDDLILEDGDTLYIPTPPMNINVIGAVRNPGAIVYIPNKTVEYYIEKCGGFSKDADKRNIFIIKADGTAITKFTRIKEVEQGDSIIVPAEIRISGWQLTKDIFALIYQLALPAAAFSK